MAGIGIELRRLTSDNTLLNLIRANAYSIVLSSGSWIISISILIGIYFYANYKIGYSQFSIQFLVAVTYLVSFSLIISSVFQQSVNCYIADKIFEKRLDLIGPSLLSVSLVLILISSIVGYTAAFVFLYDQPLAIKLVMASTFVILNVIWLFSNALTGLKNYHFILFFYTLSNVAIFIMAIVGIHYQLLGLAIAYYIGNLILFTAFFTFIFKEYPTNKFFRWEVMSYLEKHRALLLSSVFFQLAVWSDKYCFWLSNISIPIIGSLRASPIYDMPMFIAFLVMLPGLAVLFYEVEANFSRYYHRYYDAMRDGATLEEIYDKQNELIALARSSFLMVLQVQFIIAIFFIVFAPEILATLGLSPIFVYLLRIDVVAASLLVFLISQINILYYLAKQYYVCIITFVFLLSNLGFTLLCFKLGPFYYGYGFAVSLLISNILAMLYLNYSFKKLTYYSFMSN